MKLEDVNLDEGIAQSDYQPSKLLERKRELIKLLEESQVRYQTEHHDHRSLQYMLDRL